MENASYQFPYHTVISVVRCVTLKYKYLPADLFSNTLLCCSLNMRVNALE
jgi:hypothetical protein